MYRQAESKGSNSKSWGKFLHYNTAICNWLFTICRFVLEDLKCKTKDIAASFKQKKSITSYQSLRLLYVLVTEKRSYLVSLRENIYGLGRYLILMSTYFRDSLLTKALLLLWIRWVRIGKWGNEGKIPLNRSILVVTKFAALHYVKMCCKPNNPSGVLRAFVAKRNKVRISALIVMNASGPCGQRNKTLKIWHISKMMAHPTRPKLKNYF